MSIPGIYCYSAILIYKSGEREDLLIDPNSKVKPTYNISAFSEGITFYLSSTDITKENQNIIEELYFKFNSEKNNLSKVGFKLFNNSIYTEKIIDFDNNISDISYAETLLSKELYIYRNNRSDK